MMRRTALRQRLIQACSLGFFLYLLGSAVWTETASLIPPDLYLRLDPLAALLIPPAARAWLPALLPGAALIVCAPLLGRLFCGYICPMGATLDLGRFIGRCLTGRRNGRSARAADKTAHRPPAPTRFHAVKYLLLAGMLTAALAGVNLLYWGSPISLATRFWGLLMHPFGLLAAGLGLDAGRPLFDSLGAASLLYLAVEPRRFDSMYFIAGLFLALFLLERRIPRFWCRYLCPAGAILGTASLRPALRRVVVDECSGCGICARACPGGAIAPTGCSTAHSECLTCMTCVEVCPRKAVSFAFFPPPGRRPAPGGRTPARIAETSGRAVLPTRRAFLGASTAGIAAAALQYSGSGSLLATTGRGSLWAADLLRPPGSLPETEFQRRCIRCGECMKICPTNALQPAWFQAGVEGMFSPVFVPRRGPCEPDCTACGRVCPTDAVRALSTEEKYRAKTGTATVNRNCCVAWAEKKRCVVCEETCPFASITLVRPPGSDIPAPVVDPARCFGCGYCEHYCVTRVPAVTVEPLNALRLASGSYRETAEQLGLRLNPRAGNVETAPAPPDGDLPPGFLPPE